MFSGVGMGLLYVSQVCLSLTIIGGENVCFCIWENKKHVICKISFQFCGILYFGCPNYDVPKIDIPSS